MENIDTINEEKKPDIFDRIMSKGFLKKLEPFYAKNKEMLLYLFFGACTTLINWGSYYFCYSIKEIPNVISTIIAWILSVAFAFITNKIWVFDSKTFAFKTLIYEIWTFTAARLITGILDVGIMYIAVDVLKQDSKLQSAIWKLLSNIIVIILNYIISKLIVFRKK